MHVQWFMHVLCFQLRGATVLIISDSDDPLKGVDYHVKVINPEKRSGYEIMQMVGEKYSSVQHLE